jgi:hypothetical protein
MTKKMMLLALAAVCAAFFAMPTVASANWKVDPENQTFTGTSESSVSGSPFVGSLTATGEPKISCNGPSHVTGGWSNGTVGSFTLDATNCSVSVIFSIPCHTAGAPLSNTIKASGGFENVTLTKTADGTGGRGITVTPSPTTVECAGISSIAVEGKVIGRLTEDPASCGAGVVDSTVTLEFLTSGGIQTPLRTTKMSASESDDLTAKTASSAAVTAALEDKAIIHTVSNTTWTCDP